MESLVQVVAEFPRSNIDMVCSEFQVISGRDVTNKLRRIRALASFYEADVKVVDLCDLRLVDGSPAPKQLFGDNRKSLQHVCVGTFLGYVASVVRNDKFVAQSSPDEFASFCGGIRRLAPNQQQNRGVGVKQKESCSKSLFTSTPLKDLDLNSFSPISPQKGLKRSLEDSGLGSSPNRSVTFADIKSCMMESPVKRLKIGEKAQRIYTGMEDICKGYKETLSDVLGHLCLFEMSDTEVKMNTKAKQTVSDILELVSGSKGAKECSTILPENLVEEMMSEFRPPDWVLLLFKLSSRLPDDGWQMLINPTKMGRTGVSCSSLFIACAVTKIESYIDVYE